MRKSILTVTVPPTTTDLTDVQTVMSEFGSATSNSESRNIARWIKQASGAITRYCKRQLAQQTVTEQFRTDHATVLANMSIDSPTRHRLPLAMYPVTLITSVTENGLVIDPSLYEIDPETGLLSRLFNDRPRQWMAFKILVEYTGGYILPPDIDANLPDEISNAAIQLVKAMKFSSRSDPTVKSEVITGVLEQEFVQLGNDGSIPPTIAALLDPFVRVEV